MTQIPMIRLAAILAALVGLGIMEVLRIRKNLIEHKGRGKKKPSWFACTINQCVARLNVVAAIAKNCSYEHKPEAEKAGNTPAIVSLQAKGSFHSEGNQCAKHKSSEMPAVENAIRILPKAKAQNLLNGSGRPTGKNAALLALSADLLNKVRNAGASFPRPSTWHPQGDSIFTNPNWRNRISSDLA